MKVALHLKTLFLSNCLLKLISLMLGYSFWYIATLNQPLSLQCTVPLCFHDLPQHYQIEAPESVTITLAGKRADIYCLDFSSLAIHISLKKPLPGKHAILLTKKHLFLPEPITLLRHSPSNLSITIKEL